MARIVGGTLGAKRVDEVYFCRAVCHVARLEEAALAGVADALGAEPAADDGDDVVLFRVGQGVAAGDPVPFFEAAAAAGGGGVLGDEDGVVAHGGLLAVVGDVRGGEAVADEGAGVVEGAGEAVLAGVGEFLRGEAEAAAEGGFREGGEEVVGVAHD